MGYCDYDKNALLFSKIGWEADINEFIDKYH